MDLRLDRVGMRVAGAAARPPTVRASGRRRPVRRATDHAPLVLDPGVLEVRAAVVLVTTTAIVAVSVGTRRDPAQIVALLGRDAAAAGADLSVCTGGTRAIRVTRATTTAVAGR